MKSILAANLRHDLPGMKSPELFHMPYGLGTIVEIMQERGVTCDLYETYAGGCTEDFLKYYESTRQDVILFSGIAGNGAHKYFDYLFRALKALNPCATIVLGGPITSVYPDVLLCRIPADIIVIGEGEAAFQELLAEDFPSDDRLLSIAGIGFKRGCEVCITHPRPPLKSPLEKQSHTPLFAHPGFRGLLDFYVRRQKSMRRGWDITATRGCLSDCTFCKKVFDKPIRFFSPEYVVGIMEKVHREHGINRFSFLDENFVTIRKYIKTFLDLLEERQLRFQWRMNARLDNFPLEYLDRMIRLGLYDVMVGVESASQKVLDYYNKKVDFQQFRGVAKELAARNLLYANFIIGAEIETEDTVEETACFIRDVGLKRDRYAISFLTALPGSRLFEDLHERGIIKDRFDFVWNNNFDFFEVELNVSPMSQEQLMAAKDRLLAAGAI